MPPPSSLASPSNEPTPAGDQAVAALNKIDKLDATLSDPPPPPSLPPISLHRKSASLNETPFDLSTPQDTTASSRPQDLLPHELGPAHAQPKTILYLAYGSNLCLQTFQKQRGIKPLAATNVVVPDLVMTFDLPGIPYTEPCFANVNFRHTTKESSANPPNNESNPGTPSPQTPLLSPSPTDSIPNWHNPHWPKGLVGVVYEVTLPDYAHIIATEGGGASYQDILIPCHELPPNSSTIPSLPTTTPFKAHTLYSPIYPPGHAPPNGGRFGRPHPGYAQPSARYLKLIKDGAAEHRIPGEYREYLRELVPYTITTGRQEWGKRVFTNVWLPIIRGVFKLNARFADRNGRTPKWLNWVTGAVFRAVWASYDGVFKRVFGDGERTVGGEGEEVGAGRTGARAGGGETVGRTEDGKGDGDEKDGKENGDEKDGKENGGGKEGNGLYGL